MVISDYYFKVLETEAERTAFRELVINRTGIAYSTFYDKLKKGTWSRAEVEVINIIIKERDNV